MPRRRTSVVRRIRDSIQMRTLPYFRVSVPPLKEEPLGLDVEMVRDIKTDRLIAGWVAISQCNGMTKVMDSHTDNTCVYQSKIKHDIRNIDLQTRWSGLTKE